MPEPTALPQTADGWPIKPYKPGERIAIRATGRCEGGGLQGIRDCPHCEDTGLTLTNYGALPEHWPSFGGGSRKETKRLTAENQALRDALNLIVAKAAEHEELHPYDGKTLHNVGCDRWTDWLAEIAKDALT